VHGTARKAGPSLKVMAVSLRVKPKGDTSNAKHQSQAQHNLMAMVAHDPAAAKRVGIPQSVGQEFVKADKGKKFGKGQETRPDLQKVNEPKVHRGANKLFKEGGHVMATKKMSKGGDTTMSNPSRERKGLTAEKMGTVRTAAPSRDGIAAWQNQRQEFR